MPRLRELGQQRLVHEPRGLGRRCRVEPRHRRVGAHAARVRARVAVADALEVLCGRERPRRLAVAEGEQRDLLADQQLLDHDGAARLAERAAEQAGLDGGQRALAVGADRDALAGGQPVGLDDAGAAQLVDGAARRVDVPGGDVARGRHARREHQLLGERLGALDQRGAGRRAEDGDARAPQRVAEPEHERQLRADHDQVGLELVRQRGEAAEVVHGHVVAGGDARDAGVAGRAVQFATGGARGERLRKRVLPPARADEQDPHRGESRRSQRLRRTARSRPAEAARAHRR